MLRKAITLKWKSQEALTLHFWKSLINIVVPLTMLPTCFVDAPRSSTRFGTSGLILPLQMNHAFSCFSQELLVVGCFGVRLSMFTCPLISMAGVGIGSANVMLYPDGHLGDILLDF